MYENNFSSNDLYASLLGINASGSLLPPTGSEVIEEFITASNSAIPLNDVNKETYKRIYHNMPYLLKKKGTVEGVRALISLFGVPDTVLRIILMIGIIPKMYIIKRLLIVVQTLLLLFQLHFN